MAILIIKKEDLPPVSGSSESYPIRYRLVSEDKSKFSYWSPIFNIPIQRDYTAVTIPVSKAGTIVSAVWNIVADVNSYDVWIRWGKPGEPGDWIFLQNTSNNSISTIIPSEFYNGGVLVSSTPNRFSIRIYETTYSIEIYPAPAKAQYAPFLLYETLDHTV
jgi:hypothetical protein